MKYLLSRIDLLIFAYLIFFKYSLYLEEWKASMTGTFPAGIALAFAVNVLAALAAEHGADALAAVLAAEARVALAVA